MAGGGFNADAEGCRAPFEAPDGADAEEELGFAGKAIDGAPLEPTWKASTVKRCEGRTIVTDGPFAELREQIGGYTLIEAKDRAEAIEIAAGFFGTSPLDSRATIEVRPVVDYKLPEK